MQYQPYKNILEQFENGKVPYGAQLQAVEWNEKRQEIIRRENNVCEICKNKCKDDYILIETKNSAIAVPATYEEVEQDLYHTFFDGTQISYPGSAIELVEQDTPRIAHVHHTYYQLGNLAWEYPDTDLMLLCHMCHHEIHEQKIIPVYKNSRKFELLTFTPCKKCNGTGTIKQYHYWFNGLCFDCKGACFEEWK